MKESKQQRGTVNPNNSNIIEWFSNDGTKVLQYVRLFDHYRIGNILDNGAVVFYSAVKFRASKYTLEDLLHKLNS